jgi:hypothetical protein
MNIKTGNIEEKIEDKVIDWMALDVGGRLIISKPEKNIFGADLLVEKRGEYKEKSILFKVCSLIGPVESIKLIKDFSEEQFKAEQNFYLLFVYFDSIKQKTSDYIWLVPSLQFKDIAEVIKSPEGQKVLRFEAFLDINKKDKYSKFLVNTKEFGKLVLESFDSGGKFNFEKTIFQETKTISNDALKEFISEARANTYAAGNSPVDNPRLLGSIQLEFQKGELFYRDIYFLGNKKFIGQEVVYQDSKPIWGMNYIGDKIGNTETNFLRESLLKLSGKCRFGQSCEFKKREFKYEDSGQGDLEDFFGQEKIFLVEKNIYKLDYRGGLI